MRKKASQDADINLYELDFDDRAEIALQKIRDVVRGNALHPIRDVELLSYEEIMVSFEAQTKFILHAKNNEKLVSSLPGSHVRKVSSQKELDEVSAREIDAVCESEDVLSTLSKVIQEREDQGYYLEGHRTPLSLDPLYFLREENCISCHGKKGESCRACQGQGFTKCKACKGQNFRACKECKGRGEKQCAKCHTKGIIDCHQCKGQGLLRYLSQIDLFADTNFAYTKGDIPDIAKTVLERLKEKLITKQHAQVHIRDDVTLKRKKNADAILTLSYDVRFPIGEAVFRIGDEDIPALVFGYKAALLDVSPFLERYVLPPFNLLREAANGDGDINGKIRAAGAQTRLSYETITNIARIGAPKTAAKLKHDYSIALEPEFIDNLVRQARGAINQLTKRPQAVGLGFGLIPACILSMFYIFVMHSGGTGTILPIRLLLDVLILFLTCVLPYIGAQLLTRQTLISVLGQHVQEHIRLPKLGKQGIWGPLAALFLFLMFSEIAYHSNIDIAPQIYAFIRDLF